MFRLPIPLICSYCILRIFHYSQWLYLREAGFVRSQKFVLYIHLFFLAPISAMIVVFLGYWGFKVSWLQAIGLFLSGFVLTMMWQPLWVFMGMRGGDVDWTLFGLAIEPVSRRTSALKNPFIEVTPNRI